MTVPAGATYQPISVSKSNLVAYSNRPFVVSSGIGGSINAATFAPKIDFASGTAAWAVAVGDVDGDGKVDLAAANRGSNTISIFRNTSAGAGLITYATNVDLTTANFPRFVSFGDLDGDGNA